MISYIVHVNIVVSNIERSVDFYTNVLGAKVVRKWFGESPTTGRAMGFEDRPARWKAYLLRFGDGDAGTYPQIDLLEWVDPPGVGRPYASMANLGIPRICVGTDDADAEYARLKELGVDLITEPVLFNPNTERGRRTKLFCLRDPDGTVIEVIGLQAPPL